MTDFPISRRDAARRLATGIATLGMGRVPAGWSAPRLAMDCLTIDGPSLDARAALRGGLTAGIFDLSMYPRSPANALAALEAWNAAFAAPGAVVASVRKVADLDAALAQEKLGVVLACQDASILDVPTRSVNDANLKNLRRLYDLGLRVLQLAHGDRNGVGDSFREKNDAGLSRLGEDVVKTMGEIGMIVDLSHCSDRTTTDAIALSAKPCAITHAGCRALYPTGRNKTDAQIRALADKGGVIGIFSMSLWLTDAPKSSVDDVVRHVEHAVKVGGVEHVAYASDGATLGVPAPDQELKGMQEYARRNLGIPGSERVPAHIRPPDMNGPDRVLRLADALARRGLAGDAVDKIIGGNMRRLIREVCG